MKLFSLVIQWYIHYDWIANMILSLWCWYNIFLNYSVDPYDKRKFSCYLQILFQCKMSKKVQCFQIGWCSRWCLYGDDFLVFNFHLLVIRIIIIGGSCTTYIKVTLRDQSKLFNRVESKYVTGLFGWSYFQSVGKEKKK